MEMVSYLESNNEESLANYQKLLKNNQYFLVSKSKESPSLFPSSEENGKLITFLYFKK